MEAVQSRTLTQPTLVLNKAWTPFRFVTAQDAIGLVAGGIARVIDPATCQSHDLVSWDSVSRARACLEAARIRSMRLAIEPPEVIVLTRYGGMGANVVVFSRANLFRRDRNTCQYCGAQPGTASLSIDHVLPRCRGGRSSWENCVVACLRCNGRKGGRTPAEAGLSLLKRPRKPAWTIALASVARSKFESWKQFLDRAYWEVELEP